MGRRAQQHGHATPSARLIDSQFLHRMSSPAAAAAATEATTVGLAAAEAALATVALQGGSAQSSAG